MEFYEDVEYTERGRPQRQAKKRVYSEIESNNDIKFNNGQRNKSKNNTNKIKKTDEKKKTNAKKSQNKNQTKKKKARDTTNKSSSSSVNNKNNKSIEKTNGSKPKSYQPIKKNEFIGRKHIKLKFDEIPRCNCKVIDGKPGCVDNLCINRALHIECTPGTCPCGDLCMNQSFQKRKYAKLKKIKTEKKGFGIVADQDIKMNDFIIEYVGEVIDNAELEKRLNEYSGERHFYCLTLSNGETIDAGRKGNISRFINHSCNPNCVTQKWQVLGEMRIGIFAKRDISKGEELTFDYQFERVGMKIQKCYCGEPNCSKYLGSRTQEKKDSNVRKLKYVSHQKHVKTLLSDQYERIEDFPYEPLINNNVWYKEKKTISIDDDDDESCDDNENYNMTSLSKSPVFLKRNAIKVRMKYLNIFKDLILEEARHTVEQKMKAKEKHSSITNDFSWLLNVNISKLLSSGAIEFVHEKERKLTRKQKS